MAYGLYFITRSLRYPGREDNAFRRRQSISPSQLRLKCQTSPWASVWEGEREREKSNEIPLDTRYCYACTRCNCPDPWRSHAICIMHARKRGCATVRRFRNHSHDALAEWRVPLCEKGDVDDRHCLVVFPLLFRYVYSLFLLLFSTRESESIQNSIILTYRANWVYSLFVTFCVI